jgi:hypothetical protein
VKRGTCSTLARLDTENNVKDMFLALRQFLIPRPLERCARKCIGKCEELKAVASQLKSPDLVTLANLSQFIAICSLDISILARNVLIPARSWKRTLHARHLALALYELSEDMPQLLGKPLRDIVSRGSNHEQDLRELDMCRSNLSKLLGQHKDSLHDVRIITVAHRDHNGTDLLKTIDGLDVDRMRELAHSAMHWCAHTLNFLQHLTAEHFETILNTRANKELHSTLH